MADRGLNLANGPAAGGTGTGTVGGPGVGGLLDKRPSALIRRYGALYAQARIDTLDALEKLPQLSDCDELKSKLLFSVVVVWTQL